MFANALKATTSFVIVNTCRIHTVTARSDNYVENVIHARAARASVRQPSFLDFASLSKFFGFLRFSSPRAVKTPPGAPNGRPKP